MNEREVQTKIVQSLRRLDFEVVVESENRRHGGTKGKPDLWVMVYSPYWIGLEIKAPGGTVRKTQGRRIDERAIYLFSDVRAAVRFCIKQRREFTLRKGRLKQ